MIVLAVVVCAAAVWMWLDVGHKPTDEEKYQAAFRSYDRAMRLAGLRRSYGFLRPLGNVLTKIQIRSLARSHALEMELHASGYVVDFTVTNENPSVLALTNQLVAARYWSFLISKDVVLVTCRSNDVARIRAALEQKP